jgi:23S rRNA (cytidine1920-2'-O)/16S rRNA (cytidine1409-2'-O)-methyltransferase
MMTERTRLDMLVWQRGLAASRTQAQGLVLAGKIAVNGQRITRAGTLVKSAVTVTRLDACPQYVSRGGEKLAAALAAFALDVRQCVAMDVGASTGGFTDCLLQAGVARVYAIDVGYGQLHWRLRNDPRVRVYERTNVRSLAPADVPERVSVMTVDVSFISLRLIFPLLHAFLASSATVIALVKPQFEVGKGQVGKGGVVRHAQQHYQVLLEVCTTAQTCGFSVRGGIMSPLRGPKGNREFLLHLHTNAPLLPAAALQALCGQLSMPADDPSMSPQLR